MGNALHDLLFPAVAGDRPYILFHDAPPMTHGAFTARSAAMAAVLQQMGLQAGMRVIVQTEKSADIIALYAACLRLGLVFVPLNPALPPEETLACLRDTAAACAIVAPDRLTRLRQMAGNTGEDIDTAAPSHDPAVMAPKLRIESLSHDGTGSFADLVRSAQEMAAPCPAAAKRAAGDAAIILYGAATGLARRGVVLSQGALVHNTRALVDLWQVTRDDILCHTLPLYQGYGLMTALHVALAGGAQLMFMRRYDPAILADTMAQCTIFMGVPSFYARLLSQNDVRAGRFDKLRLLLSGTAPLSFDTHAAFKRLTGLSIADHFALPETGLIAAHNAGHAQPHSEAGLPLAGIAMRITDDEGTPLPPATTGMIEVKTPALHSGIITAQGLEGPPLREGGWYVTGELGQLSHSGTLTLAGKAQEQIVSGGFVVDPAEVETALGTLPDVSDAAVIGLPHPSWGEVVVAVVVPKQGAKPDAEELLADLGHALARFKRPRHVVFTDRLPRNALGRVRKDTLRQEMTGMMAEL